MLLTERPSGRPDGATPPLRLGVTRASYPDKLLWHDGIVAHPMLCILACMTDTDRPEFFRRLGDLAKMMRHEPPMSVMDIYYRALADLPLAAVVFGLDASATHGQHFPRPAEIRERVREERKRRQLEKSTREALSEGPGEPIALPPGFGPQAMAPAKPVKRIEPTAAPRPPAVTTERQRRAGETWDQSMDRLRRQRETMGLTDADVEAAKTSPQV